MRQKSIVPIHSSGVYVSCSKNEYYADSKLYLPQNRRYVMSFYFISDDECPNFLSENLTPEDSFSVECIVHWEGAVYEETEQKEYSPSIHTLKSFKRFPEIETVPAKGQKYNCLHALKHCCTAPLFNLFSKGLTIEHRIRVVQVRKEEIRVGRADQSRT